jgi:dUTP pyrophosphatase
MIKVHIKKQASDVRTPTKATAKDAAYDIYAYMPTLPGPLEIKPHQTVRVKTGLHMCSEEGYYITFVPRSGMAYKDNIIVANTPATIDENYAGECMVLLHNQGAEKVSIFHDERIAQMMVKRRQDIEFIDTDTLPNENSERGNKGFGSSGK